MPADPIATDTGRTPSPPPCLADHLDAICRWAEALVDLRTAEAIGDLDPAAIEALAARVVDAEEGIAAVSADARGGATALPFESLERTYGLDADEARVLKLALAPSLDTSFRKRVARFKDNVLLDYVDVDFVLAMLFESRIARMRGRRLFHPDGTLARERLVTLSLPRDAPADTLLNWAVEVPERVVTFLLGHDHLEKGVAAFGELSRPATAPEAVVLDPARRDEVLSVVRGWDARGRPRGASPGLVLSMFGPPGTGKSLFAGAVAAAIGKPLITVDSAKLAADERALADGVEAIFFDAKVRGAVLAFDRCEALFSQRNPRIPTLYARIERHPGVVILISNDPKQLDPSLERYIAYQVEFEAPDTAQRERLWSMHLDGGGIGAGDGVDVPALAMTFEFTGGQVRNAVAVAREFASARGASSLTHEDLVAGSWAQVRADMEEYSKKRKVRLTLDDLILPDDEMKQVREVLEAAQNKTFIMTRWGFGKRLTTGKGLCCLFLGEPGTGKTLCAEILAESLGQNLYQISIPRVMSKYIGETEKNIERIFSTARANSSMLLFDEADALFSTRVKVETSVDRFSNMEINLLLQEIERFEGVVILTTNLEKNVDKAFERRVQFKIRFPFPDKVYRARIWRTLVPRECPIDPDIDWDRVGESFELSGGNIKNAILRAAYKAARDTKRITMDHIVAAAEAECRQAGRLFRGLKKDED
jgi:SpoVK/Ycf46/Vps4 family AAA+-type ATPase